ncbi:fasciclin domain-containing protein, partial [Verrucosispora sp. SN26_14.1]
MKRMHTSVLTLACACLLALTACGGDSADTAADTAPSAVPPTATVAPPSATPT